MATGVLTSGEARNFYEEKTGFWSWALTTDHKRIGLMYLYSIIIFFLLGMFMGFD